MKKVLISAVLLLTLVSGLFIAFTFNEESNDSNKVELYQMITNSGFEGSYEEFLKMISSKEITYRLTGSGIEWSYVGTTPQWTPLLPSKGSDGLTAYEIWLTFGNEGDELDFISSLSGENGMTAYELWLTFPENNGKSEAAFLESLKADNLFESWLKLEGNDGLSEDDMWLSLVGEPGKSAYELFLEDTNTNLEDRNEQGYLNYIKGKTGLSAYDIWKFEQADAGLDSSQEAFFNILVSNTGFDTYTNFYKVFLGIEPNLTEEEWLNEMYAVYNVTFDTGVAIQIPQQQVIKGKKITDPKLEVYDGKYLEGWYYEGVKWSFELYAVTEDMTLTAKWIYSTVVFPDFKYESGVYKYIVNSDIDHFNLERYIEANVSYSVFKDDVEIEKIFELNPLDNIFKIIDITGHTFEINIFRKMDVTVSFETNTVQTIDNMYLNVGDSLQSIKPIIKEGYTFLYWSIDGNEVDVTSYVVSNDITLVAIWEANNYTVKFDLGLYGGEFEEVYAYHSEFTLPTSPPSDDMGFLGWYLDGILFEDTIWTISKNVTLTAKWLTHVEIYYYYDNYDGDVTDINGFILEEYQSYGYEKNEFSLIELKRESTAFLGWYYTPDFKIGTEATSYRLDVQDKYEFYAKWDYQYYTLELDTNGGNYIGDTIQEFRFNEKYIINEAYYILNKAGFMGWYDESGSFFAFSEENYWRFTRDIKFTAEWKHEVNIQYHQEDFDDTVYIEDTTNKLYSESLAYSYNNQYTLPRIDRVGANFIGWYLSNDYNMNDLVVVVDLDVLEDYELYAKWQYHEIVLSFDLGYDDLITDNTFNPSQLSSIYEKYGNDIVLYNDADFNTPIGYKFIGWYVTNNNEFIQGFMPSRNTTIYAKWEKIKYTINYYDDTVLETSKVYYIGDNIEHPTLTKDYHEHTKWLMYFHGDYIEVCSNEVNLYAANYNNEIAFFAYFDPIVYQLDFITYYDDLNENYQQSGYQRTDVQSISEIFGESIILVDLLAPTGYTFAGWYYDDSFNDKAELTEMPALYTTLHAKWEKVEYTINYLDYDDSIISTSSYYIDDILSLPANPERDHYNFDCWKIKLAQYNWFDYIYSDKLNLYYSYNLEFIIKAYYSPLEYSITFADLYDGLVEDYMVDGFTRTEVDDITQGYDTELNTSFQNPNVPLGYTFEGWYYKQNEQYIKFEYLNMPGFDVHLTPVWEEIVYTVYLYDHDGVYDKYEIYTISSVFTAIYEQQGYEFKGWLYQAGVLMDMVFGNKIDLRRIVDKQIKLYAYTKQISYRFVLDGMYDSINEDYGYSDTKMILEDWSYYGGDTISIPTLNPPTGYKFIGWEGDGLNGQDYTTITTMPFNDIELKAKWEAIEYKVNYYCQFTAFITSDIYTVVNNYVLESPNIPGYEFIGWFSDDSFTTKITQNDINPFIFDSNKEITLYSSYELIIYTVKFADLWSDLEPIPDIAFNVQMSVIPVIPSTSNEWYYVTSWKDSNGYFNYNEYQVGTSITVDMFIDGNTTLILYIGKITNKFN